MNKIENNNITSNVESITFANLNISTKHPQIPHKNHNKHINETAKGKPGSDCVKP